MENNLISQNEQLPDTLEDLSRFVLVNEERIQALRAEIRAIKKVNLAKEVYEQKLQEAQEIGQITVEAAQKMGELLLQIQKRQGAVNTSRDVEELKTKTEITADMGMTKDQVSQYQQMALNPEAVQKAIQDAIDRGDVVSQSQVMREIRALKDQLQEARAAKEIVKEVIKEVPPADYEDMKRYQEDVRRDYQISRDAAEKARAENERLRQEIEELKGGGGEEPAPEQAEKQLRDNAIFFQARVSNFLKDTGGYVYIADRLNEIDERSRGRYISAVMALHEWTEELINRIENVAEVK